MVVGLGRAMVSQLDCQPGTSGRGLVTHTAQSCRRRTRILQQRVVARSAAPAKGRSERAVSWHPGVASVDAPATPQPATKTFASFDKMLDDNELPVLVDFHAHWCGPCQMMGHVVSTVSKRLDGAVTCVRIDCDKYPALASKYKVQALPTLVLFKDGKPIDKVEGFVALQPLLDRVNYYLGRPMGPGRRFRP